MKCEWMPWNDAEAIEIEETVLSHYDADGMPVCLECESEMERARR